MQIVSELMAMDGATDAAHTDRQGDERIYYAIGQFFEESSQMAEQYCSEAEHVGIEIFTGSASLCQQMIVCEASCLLN
jgi:hypothetical protein